MSIISHTYKCDWPGCDRQLVCKDQFELSDHNWEGRCLENWDWVYRYHVCAVHRGKTNEQLLAALADARLDDDCNHEDPDHTGCCIKCQKILE